jgi:hypothetical protein
LIGWDWTAGPTLIVVGAFGMGWALIERWRSEHGYGSLRDWRLGRGAYFLPMAAFGIGLSLVLLVSGHTSPWIGLGTVLVSSSVTGAGMLAIRRAMLNTD